MRALRPARVAGLIAVVAGIFGVLPMGQTAGAPPDSAQPQGVSVAEWRGEASIEWEGVAPAAGQEGHFSAEATDLLFRQTAAPSSSGDQTYELIEGHLSWSISDGACSGAECTPCTFVGSAERDLNRGEGSIVISAAGGQIKYNLFGVAPMDVSTSGCGISNLPYHPRVWLCSDKDETTSDEELLDGSAVVQVTKIASTPPIICPAQSQTETGSLARAENTISYSWHLEGSSNAAFTVNSDQDQPDNSVGDNICSTGETVNIDGEDVDECTLRAAIQEANDSEDNKHIVFDIPGGNLPFISPESPLPALTGGVDINGTTQPVTAAAGDEDIAAIQIDGTNAGDSNGLVLQGLANRVRGVVISNFDQNGILIDGGSGNTIQNVIIGTDHSGTPMPNNETAIKILDSDQNQIGGTGANQGNVIANSLAEGIFITGEASHNNFIEGNFIGVNSAGEKAANATGIYVLDAPNNTIGPGNTISGNNLAGVHLLGAGSHGNTVKGNRIGFNIDFITIVGNGGDGVLIENGGTNFIGGQGANANVIVGNKIAGVAITGATASNNVVSGNYIGTDSLGRLGFGNEFGVTIANAPQNFIGGSGDGEGNVIGGSNQYGVAIINALSTDNRVIGNFIGVNQQGEGPGNHGDGVLIEGASNNRIGGLDDGNVISGNGGDGIEIHSAQATATDNKIIDNIIGLMPNGVDALQNAGNGVNIAGAPANTIGGTGGEGNVISGNFLNGILIAGEEAEFNLVYGNYIGNKADNSGAAGNHQNGILIEGAPSNRIGNPDDLTGRNVISGNGGDGVLIKLTASQGNWVRNNIIGSDDTGMESRPNEGDGVHIQSSLNLVGGTDASRPAKCSGVCNLISANNGNGVFIDGSVAQASSNLISGNAIGLKNSIDCMGKPQNGALDCQNGNTSAAVRISGNAAGNHVGGYGGISLATFCTGDCNAMAYNGAGVVIEGNQAALNNVQANYEIGNGGLPIDLGGDGPTTNDDIPPGQDQDNGPNMKQNFPRIEVAGEKGDAAWVPYTFRSTPNTGFTIDVFGSLACPGGSGVAEMHLGYQSITTDTEGEGGGSVDVSLPTLADIDINFITLTATDDAGNTSEVSPCVELEPLTDELMHAAAAGDTVLFLESGRGISTGDVLEAADGAVHESAIVQWFEQTADPQSVEPNGGGVMVTLEAPLQFSYPAGATITDLGPEGAPAMSIDWGDVDCLGGYSLIDAVQLLRGVIGIGEQGTGCPDIGAAIKINLPEQAPVQGNWGDLDCDGTAGVIDALFLLREKAGVPFADVPQCSPVGAPVVVRQLG